MTFDPAGHFDDWRWEQFKELVTRHGGTILARVGNDVKVRMRGETLLFTYTGGAS